MQKFLALLISLVFALCLFIPVTIQADSTPLPKYVRIISNDTYLYAKPDNSKPLFALEHSYYAKVMGIEGIYYRVEICDNVGLFNKITGYVLVSKVEGIDTTPVTPFYPSVSVNVTSNSAKIYLHPDESSSLLIRATYSQIMAYYGSIVVGGINWYYVNCADYMGYVNSASVSKASVPSHPTPISDPVIEPEPPTDPVINPDDPDPTPQPVPDDTGFDGIQLALILLITIPSVVIVIMLFSPASKGGRKKESHNYKSAATATQTSSEKRAKPRYFDDYL